MALHEYILSDPLLGKFFEPFLFELLPAMDHPPDVLYLKEVELCDIYLGLLGKDYGREKQDGISATELEFDCAARHYKTRLLFLTNDDDQNRHPKQLRLINKAQDVVVRKNFSSVDELKANVYSSLLRYLEEKKIIQTSPFDATLSDQASLDDLDIEKIQSFVRLARVKRGFSFAEIDGPEKILTDLNLMENNRITHAAILLFGKAPQRYFINSEVRCASFLGTTVEKPIYSYKVFKGTLFELIESVMEFILSKLDYRIGTRAEHLQIPGGYEIPQEIIVEGLVNAIVHRTYESNGSVQVMVFRDRLEISNPGSLPIGWTTKKLKQSHISVPANPLLAEPMYLTGYIERLGTGTSDMVIRAKDAGLREPDFIQEQEFKTVIYRPNKAIGYLLPSDTHAGHVSDHVAVYVSDHVKKLILVLEKELSREEIMNMLHLKHKASFRENYLHPALRVGIIEMTLPDKARSTNQKYRLTVKGRALRRQLK